MYELAKRIVCSIIATVLSTTVTIVQGLLPLNPHWLERVANLALHFRAVARGATPEAGTADIAAPGSDDRDASTTPSAGADEAHEDLRRILAAYQRLWDFVQAIRAKGLALDDDFLAKVEREWSVSTLLTYLTTADRTLQRSAADAQAEAARLLAAEGAGHGGSA